MSEGAFPHTSERNMSTNRFLKAMSAMAVGFALLGAGASQAQSWRTYLSLNCESWNWNREYRCLLNNEEAPSQKFTVTNRMGYGVSFNYDEYHSTCGFPSNKIQSQYVYLQPYETRTFHLLAPRRDIT